MLVSSNGEDLMGKMERWEKERRIYMYVCMYIYIYIFFFFIICVIYLYYYLKSFFCLGSLFFDSKMPLHPYV